MKCLKTCLIVVALLAMSGAAVADEVIVRAGQGRLPFSNVRIQRVDVERGELVWLMPGGNEQRRPLRDILRVSVEAERSLTEAERLFAEENFDRALAEYRRAVRSNTEWVRIFASIRLAEVADRTGQFDAAVSGYIALSRISPALAEQFRPTVPQRRTSFLDTAARELNEAVAQARTDEQRQGMLMLLMDIHQARGDNDAYTAALRRLSELDLNADNPAMRQALATIGLVEARTAFNDGNLPRAREQVRKISSYLTDPRQQSDALLLLADLALRDAGDDPHKLIDAAIAYMRVVAHFKDAPGRPNVAAALLRTAEIHEKLGPEQRITAKTLYRQVTTDFETDPAAQIAREALARLEAEE